jgi:hypothetical protein
MRIMTLAMAVMLAAAFPADAAKKRASQTVSAAQGGNVRLFT